MIKLQYNSFIHSETEWSTTINQPSCNVPLTMINRNIGIVETCHGLQVISNKCQLFCTREQSTGGKWGSMIC